MEGSESQLLGYEGLPEGSEGFLEGSGRHPAGSEGHPAGSEGKPGGDGGMDRWTDRQIDKQNFSPFYKTLSPLRTAAQLLSENSQHQSIHK